MPPSRLFVLLVSLCAVTMNLRSVAAQPRAPQAEPPIIEVAGCGEFFAASLWRQGVSQLALQGGVLRVTIVAESEGWVGELRTRSGEREIQGASCEEVAGALALVVAMSLREESQTPEPVAEADPEPPPLASTALVEAAPPPADPVIVPALAPARAPGFYAGLSLLASYGDLPATEAGFGAHAAVLMPSGRSFRLALTRESATTQGSPGARFALYAGEAEFCPVTLGRSLVLGACGLIEAGLLRAEGLEAMETNSASRPWLALGGRLVARYAVNRRWFTEIGMGAVLPVQRDHFYFEPDASVHRVSALVARGTFSMGLRIW